MDDLIPILAKPKPKEHPVSDKAIQFWENFAGMDFDPAKKYEAARLAGYNAGSLSQGVNSAVRQLANNRDMQDALKKKGLDMDALAEKLVKLLDAKSEYYDKIKGGMVTKDDNYTQLKAFELAAKIKDVFPSQKIDVSSQHDVHIQITQETVNRGIKAADAEVVPIDAIESEFLE